MTKTQISRLPFKLDRTLKATLQQQIFDEFARLIDSGLLPPGEPLISIREFSEIHGVSRNTTVRVFERLVDEGWIDTRCGMLARVATHAPKVGRSRGDLSGSAAAVTDSKAVRLPPANTLSPRTARIMKAVKIDFRVGAISADLLPKAIFKDYVVPVNDAAGYLCSYQPPHGMQELREAIAGYVAINKGILVDAENIVIVHGIQEGLSLAAYLYCKPGITVWMEHPCYRGAHNIFQAHHAQIRLQDVDDQGMVLDGMPTNQNAIVHVTPVHQYPLGIKMSTTRRDQLVRWARESGSLIIENSYDGDFCYEYQPEIALAAMAPERVVHIGSFSKVFGPGFRLGYMICPPAVIDGIKNAKSLLNAGTSFIEQAMVADMMTTKRFAAHLRRMRRFYMLRRDALVRVLMSFGGFISGAQGATHVCWTLPPGAFTAVEVRDAMSQRGVRVYTLDEVSLNYCSLRARSILVLGYGAVSLEDIAYLWAVLRDVLKSAAVK